MLKKKNPSLQGVLMNNLKTTMTKTILQLSLDG